MNNILLHSVIENNTGYSILNKKLIYSLFYQNYNLSINVINNKKIHLFNEKIDYIISTCINNKFYNNFINIFCCPAVFIKNCEGYKIAYTMTETVDINNNFFDNLFYVDEIWAPSIYDVNLFNNKFKKQCYHIPIPINNEFFNKNNPGEYYNFNLPNGFIFLSVGSWTMRKGYDILIRAFLETFKNINDVYLVIKFNDIFHKLNPEKKVYQIANELNLIKDIYKIILINKDLSKRQLQNLYYQVKQKNGCYISCSIGEGDNLPLKEAMSNELLIAATYCRAHVDYLNDENANLINISGIYKNPDLIEHSNLYKNCNFFKIDYDSLCENLSNIYFNHNMLQYKCSNARKIITEFYNNYNFCYSIKNKINNIFEKTKIQFFIKNKKIKIANLSLYPPQKSGVANYCNHLIKYLSQDIDVDIFVDKEVLNNINENYNFYEYEKIYDFYNNYDFILYHFGNDNRNIQLYNIAKKIPGILDLHEITFLPVMIYNKNINEIKNIYNINYIPTNYLEFPIFDKLIEYNIAAIVHNKFSEMFFDKFAISNKIFKINLGINIKEKKCKNKEYLNKLNIKEEDIVIVYLGYINEIKFHNDIIELLKNNEGIHLLIIGENLANINIKQYDNIHYFGYLSDEEIENIINISYVGINLRKFTFGESSHSTLKILSYGKPMIVSKLDSFIELPDLCTFKIKDCNEIFEILNLLKNKNIYENLNFHSSNYIKLEHDMNNIYKEYINLFRFLKEK